MNPPSPIKSEITAGGTIYRTGDRVMQILNNYDKDVYNGEMGIITDIITEKGTTNKKTNRTIVVQFDRVKEFVHYKDSELDQLLLAYAVTIHKSQGNEFPVVVIPLHKQHWRMLQRNLIYTAITRGKKLVIIVGDKEALETAIATKYIEGIERYTNLVNTLNNFNDETALKYWKSIEIEAEKQRMLSAEQNIEIEEAE